MNWRMMEMKRTARLLRNLVCKSGRFRRSYGFSMRIERIKLTNDDGSQWNILGQSTWLTETKKKTTTRIIV